MTFGEMKTALSRYLDDPDMGYHTDSDLGVYLNFGQKEAQKKLLQAGENYYLKCVSTTLVVDQRRYSLPTDFVDLNRLEVVLSGTAPNENWSPILPITVNQKDLIGTGKGTPQVYYLGKDYIEVFPAPDATKTMRLEYSYLVADMTTSGEEPDVPESYHEYIVLKAAQRGFARDQKSLPQSIAELLAQYEEMFTYDAEERTEDSPRHVVVTDPWDEWGDGELF